MRVHLLTTTAVFFTLGFSAQAADFQEKFEGKPAVSGINGKLEIGYSRTDVSGTSDDLDALHGIGSIALPVAQQFGVQIDAGVGRFDTDPSITAAGVGAHGFWRNPDQGLLGVYGHYVRTSGGGQNADVWRLGAEGEAYFDRISVEAFVGADFVDTNAGNDTFFNGDLVAAFYATDNIRIHAGVGHQFDETFAKVGGEAMLPFASNNVSLFADAGFGEDTQAYKVGLRIYFGESGKSLKARHREDDPQARLLDFFGAAFTAPDNAAPPCTSECAY
ncbi:hypothetical protein ASD64_06790 [Mesorhizobium sp. Root157]|uniref:hypothetical protein n=1 Tax=Mesorhizobium sp. Root157 TaxID=1736477 RepID=UPI0006F5E4E7|nr:hypothetical protein [Mesorhizobium sp. Root157]KQZ87145.1 hypothetical protein ASD64_06790 [Mesorhizobium sp. Root157]